VEDERLKGLVERLRTWLLSEEAERLAISCRPPPAGSGIVVANQGLGTGIGIA